MGSVPSRARNTPTAAEAVIIGGGTAGLFTAYLLAREGVRVRLFDSAERLGPPARTLIITGHLSDLLGAVPAQAVINRTPALQVLSPQRSATIRLREPDLIVERQALVEALAEKAAAAGAGIRLGCRFTGFTRERDGITAHLESRHGTQQVRTRNLIGADGANSQVAAAAGLGGFGMVSLLQARVPLPSWAQTDTTQVWLDPQSTPFFYWLEPECRSSAVVGLIADDAPGAQAGLRAFLARQNLTPISYQAAEIPCYRPHASLCRQVGPGRVFLVGDAAGQVKMTTVGGVVTGLRGAEALARVVVRGTGYQRELAALHRELTLHLLVHTAARRLGPADCDELVSLVDQRVERIMASHTRDEIARILFPSLLAQPRLLLLGIRLLLRPFRPGPAGDVRAEHSTARSLSHVDSSLR